MKVTATAKQEKRWWGTGSSGKAGLLLAKLFTLRKQSIVSKSLGAAPSSSNLQAALNQISLVDPPSCPP